MWFSNYFLMVFLAVIGVIQLAAVYNNFRGLLFFPVKILSLIFGIIAVGMALAGFFFWYDIYDIVVEGAQQTGSFVFSAGMGIVFTLVLSSLVNHRRFNSGKPQRDGMDNLQESTFFQAVRNNGNKKVQ
jgi:phosphate/sulfate permease